MQMYHKIKTGRYFHRFILIIFHIQNMNLKDAAVLSQGRRSLPSS